MKNILGFAFTLFLAACSATTPNLIGTQAPILNIEKNLATMMTVNTERNSVQFTNLTNQPLVITYHLFWYDKQGVTQLYHRQQESLSEKMMLHPQEKKSVLLPRPTPESLTYRIYLQ